MVIAILFVISWLLLAFLFTSSQALDRRESVFLFMVILSLNISVSWIIGYEMGKIAFAKQPVEYGGYLLHRSVLVPLLPICASTGVCSAGGFGGELSSWSATDW